MTRPSFRTMPTSLLTALLMLCALAWGTLPALAENWESESLKTFKSELPQKGRTLKIYVSPDRKHRLIIRDEKEVGDFVWHRYYYDDGKSYACFSYLASNPLPRVTWEKDYVTFKADQATGPFKVECCQIEYYPAKKLIRTKVLKTIRLPQ